MKKEELIAKMIHECIKVYCEFNGDNDNIKHWDSLSKEAQFRKESGIYHALATKNKEPKILHEEWMDYKIKEGWTYGIKFSCKDKTHPCLLPYEKLPDKMVITDILTYIMCDLFFNK